MLTAWRTYLVVGAAVVLWYPLLPDSATGVGTLVVGASAVVAMLVGLVRHRPQHQDAWWLLTGGITCLVVGDALFSWYGRDGRSVDVPGVPDVVYLAAYPLLFLGISRIVRWSGSRSAAAWLDAGVWAGGALVTAWLPLLAPVVRDESSSVLERATALAYPAMDLILLLLVVHQLSARARRGPSHRLLLLALAALLVSDVVFGTRSLTGSYQQGELTDLGWLLSYLLVGAAALHPRMVELTEPSAPALARPQWRALSLVVPTAAPPVVLLVLLLRDDLSGDEAAGYTLVASSAVIFLLTALRGRGLLAELSTREQDLEATLRERERLAEELRSRATRCDLTGLVNRRGFLELVTDVLSSPERMAVGLLDLDDFKGVNDTLGHDVGDALLVQVATRLRQAVGPRDVVGRLGGDEFAVLLRGEPEETATRIIEVLSAPLLLEGHELRVEASLGVVERTPGAALGDLLRRADVAMYAAKAAGGNRWLAYRDEMSSSLLHRIDLRSQLVTALERDEVVPWFQPVVELDTGRLVGFEALARWVHPTRAVEGPASWIRLAEQTGLVVTIDLSVLESSLRQLARWRAATPHAQGLHLAVNASGRTLQEPGTAARVLGLLARTGVPPECLVLEVTEGVLLEDEAVGRRLQHLRAEGVRIALDDFGTGWSSLSYLSRFPVDVLKLDRSFTATLHHGRGGEAVPAAVVQLARALDLSVVAEGIETRDQAEQLRRLGAQHGQGYLFGRPADAAATFERVLEPQRSTEAGLTAG